MLILAREMWSQMSRPTTSAEANSRISQDLGFGNLQYVLSGFGNGRLFIMSLKSGGAFLVVHTEKRVNVSLAKYALEKVKALLDSAV